MSSSQISGASGASGSDSRYTSSYGTGLNQSATSYGQGQNMSSQPSYMRQSGTGVGESTSLPRTGYNQQPQQAQYGSGLQQSGQTGGYTSAYQSQTQYKPTTTQPRQPENPSTGSRYGTGSYSSSTYKREDKP